MEYATLTWSEAGEPESAAHGDVYFSRAGGRAETECVFLGGNGLPQRWERPGRFTIAETGFGTGLNFLHAAARFYETAPADAHLHFISTENAPLHPDDLTRAHAAWPELAALSRQLRAAYPLPIAGWHRLPFGRVTLTLGLGDAKTLLAGADFTADAWFLDGFSPAKNPDLWTDALLAQIARLSGPGTTLASFTAAGHVRRALGAHGFSVTRAPGFGHKRHRLEAHYPLPPLAGGGSEGGASIKKNALVIGAGIAGASAARALAERGFSVTVLERAEAPALAASGNPAGVLYPQLTRHPSRQTDWYMSAYAHALRLIARIAPHASASPGMLKLPKDAKEEEKLRAALTAHRIHPDVARFVEPDEASALCGWECPTGGLWFAGGSYVRPAQWIAALLDHPNIMLRCNMSATPEMLAQQGAHSLTVIANAQEAARLVPGLKLASHAGQISQFPATQTQGPLRSIVCHGGYVIPCSYAPVSRAGDALTPTLSQREYLAGATYEREDKSGAVTDAGHASNRASVEAALPGWLRAEADLADWTGRTSFRATTPDRMPIVGALSEHLYISVGHGSRGMLSAPLAGEVIASLASGDMPPVSRELLTAVSPLRPQVWTHPAPPSA